MRTMMVLAVVMVSACGPAPLPGAPKLGSACDSATAVRECYTEASIAFCDGSTWAEYPCADRCSNAQDPKCTLETRHAGDPCPSSWETFGQCDGTDLLTCVGGKWELKSHCTTCTREASGLVCR